MIGLGAGLTSDSGSFEDTPFTALFLRGALNVSSSNDENIAIILDAQGATKRGLNYNSFAEYARITGVTANVTVVHTHGEDGVALDPVVTQSNKTLYVYKTPAVLQDLLGAFILNNADASSSAFQGVDFTASPFSGIDAVGSGNKYTITLNFIAKSGLTNSGALAPVTDKIISAA
tara:strand:+ start:433 stop:957 length:525 start_codon:yes stop_codon:yes gene_type:complete